MDGLGTSKTGYVRFGLRIQKGGLDFANITESS